MVLAWQLESEDCTDKDIAPYVGKEIDLLYELPLVDEDIPAVYFVFYGPELIYIGSSDRMSQRMRYYHRDKRYGRLMWTQIGVLPVPSEMRFTIEAHYIKRFWPAMNKACA